MSLSKAVSSPMTSADRVARLALARRWVKYIISGSNQKKFSTCLHGEYMTETWGATFSGEDLTFRLRNRNRDGEILFGPPQRVLTQRDVYVHADPWRCTVNIQQVDAFSDGMQEEHKFVLLPCPTEFIPRQAEFVGHVPEEFASYPVLQDPELLMAIARNMDLGWSNPVVDY